MGILRNVDTVCHAPSGWRQIGPDFVTCRDCGFTAHWLDQRSHTGEELATQRRIEQLHIREFLESVPKELEDTVMAVDAIARRLAAYRMEQQEAFLAQHLDKRETHWLCLYPERHERKPGVGTLAHSQLIALIPKEREAQGIPTPPEYALKHFPSISIEWETQDWEAEILSPGRRPIVRGGETVFRDLH